MVNLKHAAALMVLVAGSVSANPIIDFGRRPRTETPQLHTDIPRTHAYMAHEDLAITLDENNANCSSIFEFVFPGNKLLSDGDLQIPVWFPAQAAPSQTDLAAFLRAFSIEGIKDVEIGKDVRPVIDRTFGLNVKANRKALKCRNVRIYNYEKLLTASDFPVSYWRSGVMEARFIENLDSRILENRELRIHLLYKQPLIKTDGKTLLYYVPFFNNVALPDYTNYPHEYRITVQCQEGFELVPRSLLSFHETPTATRLVIDPKDSEVILVELVKAGQGNASTSINPSWLSESQWLEKTGDDQQF